MSSHITSGTRGLIAFAALALATASWANINLELRPATQTVDPNAPVAVELYAVSDSTSSQFFASAEVIIGWDPAVLQMVGVDNTGAVASSFSGFPANDPYGLNEAVPPLDGNGLYMHSAAFMPYFFQTEATPAGTLLTTFRFTAIAPSPASPVSILATGGSPQGATIVYGIGSPVPPNVTGVLGPPAIVVVNPPPSATLTLSASGGPYAPGALIDVYIDLSSSISIVSGNYDLLYDPNVLDYVSAGAVGAIWPIGFPPIVDEFSGTLSFGVGGSPPGATSGTMARIRFNALTNVCDAANLVRFKPEPSFNGVIGAGSEILLVGSGLTVVDLGPLTVLGCGITTAPTLCPFAPGNVASVPLQPGATYHWTVSGNAILASGQGTHLITYDTLEVGAATIDVVVTFGDCTCTDSATVAVSDTTPPQISCPDNIVEVETPGTGGKLVAFTVTATDDCGAPNVVALPPSGSFFPVGTTTVYCTATDQAGNSDTCSFTVTILSANATIEGQVRTAFNGAPFPDVGVRALNAGVSTSTGAAGEYTLIVLGGILETVVPCKDGWLFTPPERVYVNPQNVLTGQDYEGRFVYDIDALPTGDGFVGPGDLSYFATSWNQSVPPGSDLHDFDCTGQVDAGDLSFFASAWLKPVFDPSISLPACHVCPPLATRAAGWPRAEVAVVARARPGSETFALELPPTLDAVQVGQRYTLEIWARDVSGNGEGLVGVFVDLLLPGGARPWHVQSDRDFGLFASGTVDGLAVRNAGGATLEPGIGADGWVRCASVGVIAERPGLVSVGVRPGRSGVAVFGRGLVPTEGLSLSGVSVRQVGPAGDYEGPLVRPEAAAAGSGVR